MRVLVLLMLLSSITVLSNCGAIKQSGYFDDRSDQERNQTAVSKSLKNTEHYYGGSDTGLAHEVVYVDKDGRRVVTSTSTYKPMFSSRKVGGQHIDGASTFPSRRYVAGQVMTSKPMFSATRKKYGIAFNDKLVRKLENAIGGSGKTFPVGYTGPSKLNIKAREDYEQKLELKEKVTNDVNADRLLSSISGDSYIPPLGVSYGERQMMGKIYEPVDYPSDRYQVLESDEEGEVYVSGEVAEQVFFGHGSSKVRGGSKELRLFAEDVINSDQRYKVSVVGHASQRVEGNISRSQKTAINYKIAEDRAHAVKNELRRAGIDTGLVVAVSKGDEEPNPYPGDLKQEDSDRRVDIYLDDLYYYY